MNVLKIAGKFGSFFAVLPLLAACAGADSNADDVIEETAQTEQALAGEYTWSVGSTTTMIHKDTGFCFLTRFSGKLRGDAEYAYLDIDSAGRWTINGRSNQGFLTATARCVNWNDFTVGGVRAARGTVSFATSYATQRNLSSSFGRSFCYLAGIGGAFSYGGGEWVSVYPGGSSWVQENHWQSGVGVFNRVACATLKDSNNSTLAFPLGPRTRVQQTKLFGAASQYNSAVALSTVSEGLCALAMVSGRLSGGGEYLNLNTSGGSWLFEVDGAEYNGVKGDAQCVYYR